jgi:thioredoxin reductase (NADPH)
MAEEKKIEEVIIIGAGPAGLAAALYSARANFDPLVFTGTDLGGQVSLTYSIENYPGFPDGLSGTELAELFKKNAEKFGARIEFDSVTAVDLFKRPYMIKTYNAVHKTKTVIIAIGASPKKLGIPGEDEFRGKGVSYCATCDGWFFRDKKVAVVGGGDSALEEAIFLTRYASSVTIIHRRDELRAGAILQERAKKNEKIGFLWDTIVTEIKGDGGLKQLALENTKSGEKSELDVDGLFVFIGHKPNSAMFAGQLDMDENGYLITDAHHRTKLPGVFAAGEIHDSVYKQVVTSAGMGAAAAIEARKFLENEESDG